MTTTPTNPAPQMVAHTVEESRQAMVKARDEWCEETARMIDEQIMAEVYKR